MVLCTSVPSLIVRNANLTKLEAYTKFYCLRLFVVVYKLVNVVEWYIFRAKEIGQGGFGCVSKAIWRGIVVAAPQLKMLETVYR